MDRGIVLALIAFIAVAVGGFALLKLTVTKDRQYSYTVREAGFEETTTRRVLAASEAPMRYSLSDLEQWYRPPGSLRVGIQVGHWKAEEAPEELAALRTEAGTAGGGAREADVVYEIATRVQKKLEAQGVRVDLVPTTVPPRYVADAFVAIHADSNANPAVSGRKIAAPRRDYSGKAIFLEEFLRDEYKKATDIDTDSDIARRVSGYYAFNWDAYEHAIHPMTPAVIAVVGFLTNPDDRAVIVDDPERAADGIANGILRFLRSRVSE